MDAFWLSLAMVFLAELGDKTQLVALTLASRFKATVVLAGILTATLAVHVISVLLGGGLGSVLPEAWIKFAAGIAFIGFGLWTLRGDSLEEGEAQSSKHGLSPFWVVVTTFFIAELGDKTMLSTVALATSHSIIPVWIGSSLGMVVSDGLAIAVGRILGTKLPERTVKVGAALVFFGFGAFNVFQSGSELPPAAWVAGAALVVLGIALFMKEAIRSRPAQIQG